MFESLWPEAAIADKQSMLDIALGRPHRSGSHAPDNRAHFGSTGSRSEQPWRAHPTAATAAEAQGRRVADRSRCDLNLKYPYRSKRWWLEASVGSPRGAYFSVNRNEHLDICVARPGPKPPACHNLVEQQQGRCVLLLNLVCRAGGWAPDSSRHTFIQMSLTTSPEIAPSPPSIPAPNGVGVGGGGAAGGVELFQLSTKARVRA